MTQRIEIFWNDSKIWTFFLKCDSIFFFEHYSMNWFLFNVFQNWTLLSNMTPRIELFFTTTQRFCSLNMTQKNYHFLNMAQRTELVFRYDPKKLNFVVECDSTNRTFFWKRWLTELNFFFFDYDSRKELHPLISWIWRKELDSFFWIWRKVSNSYMMQRI